MNIDQAPAARMSSLYKTELRMLLRDRRTVIVSIVLPLVVMPLVMFGSHWLTQRREKKLETAEFVYAITGTHPEFTRALIERSRLLAQASDSAMPLLLKERETESALDSLKKGVLDFYVETSWEPPSTSDSVQAASGELSEPSLDHSSAVTRDTVPTVFIYFRADRTKSERGMEKLRDALFENRQHRRHELLTGAGFPIAPDAVGVIHEKNVAGEAQVAGLHMGRMAVLFFLVFIITGGSVVAIDSLAGEKERGTLETLLTTSIARSDIITAKHLVILTVAVVIALIQSLNLLVYIAFEVIPLPANMAFKIPPGTVVLVLLFLLPVAGLAASILLLTSGYAKTYKEAQLYFFPVFLLSLIPALAPFLPGITLRSAIVVVPVANIAVAVKEILVGDFDWLMLILAWILTAAAAVWVRRLAERTLSTERLIVPSTAEAVGSLVDRGVLFQRQVLPAFALIWAVFLLVSMLEENVEIRLQALINLVVIFLGASLFLIQRYRLPWKGVLAVRSVRPVVWPLVVVGAPAGLLTASGVFQLVSHVLPVPQEILEEFSDFLLPEGVPVWQLVFFVAILPGICEEMTFRGVLLYGLRRQFHPVGLALIVGFIFGLFHIALFRIIPVTFLGILLAGVTLLTGSIFPAMLWHALTNAAGIIVPSQLESLTEFGAITYPVAAAIVLSVFALLWRFRTPYPDLRAGSPKR